MATCKDCIHERICWSLIKMGLPYADGEYPAETFCMEFENKADVVEVVRCKDCDVPHNKWLGCPHLNGLIPPPDFYCAKGTPKERGGEK